MKVLDGNFSTTQDILAMAQAGQAPLKIIMVTGGSEGTEYSEVADSYLTVIVHVSCGTEL